jgi:exodeoxyribonuclease VII small subunit
VGDPTIIHNYFTSDSPGCNRRFTFKTKLIMAKKTFESALSKLEQITTELEEGELGLEKSLKKFDEGITLVDFCSEKLEQAKNQVELLMKKNGKLSSTPFPENNRHETNL